MANARKKYDEALARLAEMASSRGQETTEMQMDPLYLQRANEQLDPMFFQLSPMDVEGLKFQMPPKELAMDPMYFQNSPMEVEGLQLHLPTDLEFMQGYGRARGLDVTGNTGTDVFSQGGPVSPDMSIPPQSKLEQALARRRGSAVGQQLSLQPEGMYQVR